MTRQQQPKADDMIPDEDALGPATTHIRFATDILRRLGEELNPSVDQGIIELVKNAYDADARRCVVELKSVDVPGGEVVVTDDGIGMSMQEIADGWLVLGSSGKGVHAVTDRGRIPAGSKGLGRLAALRLGQSATLTTRSKTAPDLEHELFIDWEDYATAQTVEDVDLLVQSRRTEPADHGTTIRISSLRHQLGRMEVKRLARSMVLLADPFADDNTGFQPELVAPEFGDLSAMVRARYFPEAEFHLKAVLDEEGHSSAEVRDGFEGLLYSATHSEIAKGRDKYACPPAQFDLWVYILNAESFRLRTVSIGEVREWLGEFGGVHLYWNGIRVSPYGNPGHDWLDMNVARARNPQERPSTNTSIGRIRVADAKGVLVQKTDRSGLIENESFSELRSFAVDAMEFLWRKRHSEAEGRRRKERKKTEAESQERRKRLSEAIEEESNETSRKRLRDAFGDYERAANREIDVLKREVQLYRTLSTAGITAATFAHESAGSPLKVITQSAKALRRRGSELGELFTSKLEDPISAIERAAGSLSVLGSVTLRLVQADKRRLRRVDVHQVIGDVVSLFGPFLDQRDVKLDLELDARPAAIRGTEAALESVVSNLLNNSLAAFEGASTASRRILISSSVSDEEVTLTFSDNGPGICGLSVEEIWLPGQTTYLHGTGLGLTIVRDAVADLGGKSSASQRGHLGGAEFTIQLPILEVES